MSRRSAFTLVELVVVIMILGILAAIAAPRLLSTTTTASDNGLRQSLAVIRDAIDMYMSQNNGALPGSDGVEATFKADLRPYLRGTFPKCPVGPTANQNASVTFSTTDPLAGDVSEKTGWKYNKNTGEFICNNETASKTDASTTYDKF